MGVEIGSNVNGISPTDVRYHELLTCLEEQNLAVFVHGIRPAVDERLQGPEVLAAIVDRLRHVWSVMPELREQIPADPLEEARRYFYDILTFSTQYTRPTARCSAGGVFRSANCF